LQELRARLGKDVVPAKVAVIAKLRKDGTKKIRIIVDMLRAGINGRIKIRERVVLPRMSDLADAALDVMEEWSQWGSPLEAQCELFAVDFEDAFYTMGIAEEERKYVVARGCKDWYAFKCVAFGLASGPLLWGRHAALASRLGQSVFEPWELRIQTFVDDPAGVVAGRTRGERSKLFTILLFFWACVGFRLSWRKGQRGASIEWIGAEFTVQKDAVKVALTSEKTELLRNSLQKLAREKGMTSTKELTKLAGQASWVASVVPRARPFVSHLWGAITDTAKEHEPVRETTRKRPKGLVFVRRFHHAISWLLALVSSPGRLTRVFRLQTRHAVSGLTVRTDASPFGFGGIVFDASGRVIAYWADEVQQLDCDRFAAVRGQPSWQAKWEFLAVLIYV